MSCLELEAVTDFSDGNIPVAIKDSYIVHLSFWGIEISYSYIITAFQCQMHRCSSI
jgi:hypothetical protein